jgi:hypothetical protein
MKTKLLSLLAFTFITFVQAQLSLDSFSHLQSTSKIIVNDMDTDASGNIYITGEFRGTVNFAPGASTPVNVTSNNGATNGGNHDQPFIAKYDQNLNLIWAKEISTTLSNVNFAYVKGKKISVNDAGKAVVTGTSSLYRWFFVYDENGTRQWHYRGRYVSVENDFKIHGATISNNDIIYVFGMLDSPNANQTLVGETFNSTNYNTNVWVQGTQKPYGKNPFIWKFDFVNNPQATSYPLSYTFENDPLYINDLVEYNNDVYITGYAYSHNQNTAYGQLLQHPDNMNFQTDYGILMKLDTSLNGQWIRSIGSVAMNERSNQLFVDSNGIYIAGTSSQHSSPTTSGGDFYIRVRAQNLTLGAAYKSNKTFMMKFDLTGTPQLGKVFHGNDYHSSVLPSNIVADNDNIYISGIYSGTQTFNDGATPTTFTSAGSYDAYLSTWSQNGTHVGTGVFGNQGDDRIMAVEKVGSHIITSGYYARTIDIDFSNNTQNITTNSTNDDRKHSFITKNSLSTLSVNNESLDTNSIAIYPNPVTSTFSINTKNNTLFKGVKLYDVTGKKVLNSENSTLDISALSKGIYILSIEYDNTIISKKIIKK